MTDASRKADQIEDRYVAQHVETEEVLTGLDPESTERGKVEAVEAVGEDRDADHVEKMAREDP